MSLRPLAAGAVAVVLLAAGPLTPAHAARTRCAAHSGTVYGEGARQDGTLRAWHHKGSLYTCLVAYRSGPASGRARTRLLGPWTSRSRLLIAGYDASWTVRTTVAGRPVDRIWTRNMWTGRATQAGLALVPAAGGSPARDELLAGWTAYDQSMAWVTRAGDVVLGADDPQGAPVGHGLPGPFVPDGRRVLVARYPAATYEQAGTLADSLHLFGIEGDGDECDTVYDATLTFIDPVTRIPLGAGWTADAHNPLCE